MKRDAAEEVKPKTCPFCGHTELTCSASGKQLMCRKCGRIVVRKRVSPEAPKPGRKNTP